MKGKDSRVLILVALACLVVGALAGYCYAAQSAAAGDYLQKGGYSYSCWFTGPDGSNQSGTCYMRQPVESYVGG